MSDCEAKKAPKTKKDPSPRPVNRQAPLGSSVRTDSNTLDLRGMRVDEAIQKVDYFLDGLLQKGVGVAYLLHGHGTGALKAALREWLPQQVVVENWRAAEKSEGGDAFTRVDLR